MKVITLRFREPSEWLFLLDLLKRLRLNFEWSEEKTSAKPQASPDSTNDADARSWNAATAEQFLQGYAESDSIYDTL